MSRKKLAREVALLEAQGFLRAPMAEKVSVNLFAMRIMTAGNERFFYCYDDGNTIYVLSGYTKKPMKIPEAAEEVDCENSIANMLYEARRLANKTQEDVAREMGISKSSFSRMERGNVTIKNFMRCLDICGFNLVLTPK